MGQHLKLFLYHVKEEYRVQSSMFKSSFLVYPFMMLTIAVVMGLLGTRLLGTLTSFELIVIAHLGMFFTGLMVGGFAMFQNAVLEKRMGNVRLLLNTPGTLPISYKRTFTYFYFKDILYYLLMNVLPLIIGLYVSTALMGIHIDLPLALLTFIMAFLTGISTCFALSTILIRSKALVALIVVAVMAAAYLAVSGSSSALTAIGAYIPFAGAYYHKDIFGLAIPLAAFIVFSAFSLAFIKETPGSVERRYRPRFLEIEKRFSVLGKYASLVSKEWLDLMRSGGLGYIMFSFVLPLLFLWGLLWTLSSVIDLLGGIRLEFNTLFYASIIGFFAIEVYGWLNNMDGSETFRTLPISLPMLIKSKLTVFFILNIVVSTGYLAFICLTRNEIMLLPAALYTMLMVSSYVGVVTAYMTGLYTNSMLFDYKVIAVYFAAVGPALVVLIVASFSSMFFWYGIGFATILGAVALLLLGRIDKKWGTPELRI